MDIEYRLEKDSNPKWIKRGVMHFNDKGKANNYKSSINVVNEPMTREMKKNIQKECENKGTYYVRFTGQNKTFFSSANPCSLIESDYHDMIVINSMPIIEEDKIISLIYNSHENYYEETTNTNTDNDSDEDNEPSVQDSANRINKNFITKVSFLDNLKPQGPIFGEEQEQELYGKKEEPKKERSWFSRYVSF